MLKSNGLNGDPWGTPKSSSDQLLKLIFTFVLCQWFVSENSTVVKPPLVGEFPFSWLKKGVRWECGPSFNF